MTRAEKLRAEQAHDSTVDPGTDLRERWHPAPAAVEFAVAALKAAPGADMAVVPMFHPGKDHGIWVTGQEVATVMGVVFVGTNSFDQEHPTWPAYSWARDQAARVAADTYRGVPGTAGHAVVHRDGTWAVFEDPS